MRQPITPAHVSLLFMWILGGFTLVLAPAVVIAAAIVYLLIR
jgi:hypothetical protein